MTSTRSSQTSAHGKRSARAVPLVPQQDTSAETKATKTIAGQPTVLQTDTPPSPLPRGTKQRLILELSQRSNGATLDELIAATGWLPHTTRAALTRLRQGGCDVVRMRREDGASAYICAGIRIIPGIDATSMVQNADTPALSPTKAS